LPFTDVFLVEPGDDTGKIPDAYKERYNITLMNTYLEVNTSSKMDVFKLLPTLVSSDDFVTIKFDVDQGSQGKYQL